MRRSGLPLVGILVSLIGGSAVAQSEPGPEHTTVPDNGVRVKLDLSRPVPIVQASINGKGPYPFLFDSGTTGFVLDGGFADELGMEVVGTQQVSDLASGVTVDTDQVWMEQIEIGDAVFSGLTAISMDGIGVLGSSGDAPRGIIGLSTFASCLFTLDYPNEALLIQDGQLPKADGRSIFDCKPEAGSAMPVFMVDVAGENYPVHIDSGGTSGITLPFNQIDSLPLDSKPSVVGQGRGANGSFEIYASRLNGTVTLGDYSWESPQVTFLPNVQWVHLGNGVLKRFAITWDQKNQRMRFVDPTGVGVDRSQSQRPKRYGIQFDPNQIGNGPIEVRGVVEGMAAKAAGVRAGDRIIAIHGESISAMSQSDLAMLFRQPALEITVERDGETIDITMKLD